MDFEHPPQQPKNMIKPLFYPPYPIQHLLCICHNFYHSYFSAIFHTKNKKNHRKKHTDIIPISFRRKRTPQTTAKNHTPLVPFFTQNRKFSTKPKY